MTLKTGLFNNIFWRSLQIFSTLVLNIVVARSLGAAGSGSFYYMLAIFTLYIEVGGLSLESGLGFFASNKKIPTQSLGAAAIAWSAVITITATFFYLIANDFESLSYSAVTNFVMFVGGTLLTNYFSSIFFAEMNFRIPNLVGTLINVGLILFLIILTIQGDIVQSGVLQVFFLTCLLRGVLMVILFYRDPEHRGKQAWITKSQALMLFRYCGLAYVSNLVFFVLYRVDYYFVEKYCSAAELGNYIQVCRIAQMFLLFPSMIATVVFPMTSSDNNHFLRTQLPAISRVLFYMYVLACGFLCLTGSWLFPFVFGADLNLMHGAFVWMVPGIVALAIQYPYSAYSGINQIAWNIKGSLVALAVMIIGDIIFIPKYGIQGAAAVSSAGYICYQLFVMIRFKTRHNIPSREFFLFEATDYHRISRSLKPRFVFNIRQRWY